MNETIYIICGGFGTRLRSVVADVPKPLAPVRGRPFLAYLLDHLVDQGACDFVLCLHHLSEMFIDFSRAYTGEREGVRIECSVEPEPLGTGGAVRFAMERFEPTGECFVLNGDTFTRGAIEQMSTGPGGRNLIGLARVPDAARYGRVETDEADRVVSFIEKGTSGAGWINSGTYRFVADEFLGLAPAGAFSMEQEILPRMLENGNLFGRRLTAEFIDIGIPEDYASFQENLETYYDPREEKTQR